MQLTNVKIEVSHQMMEQNNMARTGHQYGIPVDVKDISKGLQWKPMWEMQDSDFAKIEEYFLLKRG